MHNLPSRGRALLLAVATIVASCGGSDDSGGGRATCVTGASVACVGPGSCAGAQICNADGESFGACDCGASIDAGVDSNPARDTAAGGDTAATTDTASGTDTATSGDTAPATDTPSDTAVAPIAPGDLPGLSLWLDADKGITFCPGATTGSVTVWSDQSPNANDAKQPAAAVEPRDRTS